MARDPAGRGSTLKLHPEDDVLIAKVALPAGSVVEAEPGPVRLAQDVAAGHKIAFRARAPGEPIHRYGQVIGVASAPIAPGDHVHTHNVERAERQQDYQLGLGAGQAERPAAGDARTFQGYLRPDGRVGTRNYLAVIATVNCSASVSRMVQDRFRDVSRDHPGIDGIIALTHRGGCGHVADGEDHLQLERVLAGYATHPNIAGCVLVGLGCEVVHPARLLERRRLARGEGGLSPPVVVIQDAGGVRRAVEAASAEVERLLPEAAAARRTPQPISQLVLGTNCGGSDSYSGITANPALGWAVDEIVRQGGAAVLGETPEIYGAEQLLVRRAVSPAVAQKLLDRIDWWRRYLRSYDADVDHNPSPGNVAGGITTVLEKALGGVAKGGTSPLVDVVRYAEPVATKGLVFMDTPGFDPVSVTGIVAGGANLLAFTTGRGSVFGCKPVPSLKLASNSAIYRRMEEDMDLDCGVILEGASIEETGGRILEALLAVASGARTKSEVAGIGEEEFDPWLPGPTL
ncbi:MAG TPA: altronate dehydratase family protein [Anaeromyxobacter sp.]|nr:altronate dehydratase family protein [Anaeromyxobacter sp.]